MELNKTNAHKLTAFSVFNSSSCADILAKSATLSCGRNWHKLPTWMLSRFTSSSTYNKDIDTKYTTEQYKHQEYKLEAKHNAGQSANKSGLLLKYSK